MFNKTKAFSSFSVDSIDKAKKFYGELLELQTHDSSMGILELHIEGSNPLVIYPKPNHVAATFTVLNFPVDNIDDAVDKLLAKGVQFEQYDAPIKTDEKGICRNSGGPAIAWFKDPSGNILSILQANEN